MSDRTPRAGRKPGPGRKGLDYENKVALEMRRAGFDQAKRLGTAAKGDVRCGHMLIECKHEKVPSLRGSLLQCEATAKVVGRRVAMSVTMKHGDRGGAILTMRWRDWLAMVGPHAGEVAPW